MEAPFTYTDDELRSYLPSGWELAEGGAPAWNARKRTLTVQVIDNVDFDWPVAVTAKEVERAGRIEALRAAMENVHRGRLGWTTKGFGLAG